MNLPISPTLNPIGVALPISPTLNPIGIVLAMVFIAAMGLLFFWMFLSYKWSSAFVLYWLALNVLSIWQQYEMIYKPHKAQQAANGGTVMPAAEPASNPGKSNEPVQVTPTTPPQRVRPRRKKR